MAKDHHRKNRADPRQILIGDAAGHSRETFAPDQIVYAQGDLAEAAFFVESGRVKISTVSPNGKEAVVAIRGEGEFFGTRCLIGKRTGSATALTHCALIRVTRPALIRMLREMPDFAVTFATQLVRQGVQDQANIVDHLINPAEKRLARTLLLLAGGVDDEELRPIESRINQSTLANMVGTTRSRVSFFMNKFKRQGLIDYDRTGRILVRGSLRGVIHD